MKQVMSMIQEEENEMLTQYQVSLCQADIEFIDDILERFAPDHPTLSDEIAELRLTLNAVLTCEIPECNESRQGTDTLCAECAAVRDDARATYRQPYSREEIEDAYSHPTERAKRDSLLVRFGD